MQFLGELGKGGVVTMIDAREEGPGRSDGLGRRRRRPFSGGRGCLVAALLGNTALCDRVRGDGCFVSGKFEDLEAPEQKAAIVWDGQREVMVLATRVRARELDDFGWMIPVESSTKPNVELSDSGVFAILQKYFRTPRRSPSRGMMGLSPAEPVEVVETKDVGIYKVTIVRATEPEALSAWLRAHGFRYGQELEDMLRSYCLEDMYFILAKIDLTLQYRADIEFVRSQAYVADVESLSGKAIKALRTLRWPSGGASLASLVVEDIVAQKAYEDSHLASYPLLGVVDLLSRERYRHLLSQYRNPSDDQKYDLVSELSKAFLENEKIQSFVRIENVYRDLEAGLANPLKICFWPSRPFFPLRISAVNRGDVSIVAYVFGDDPVSDGSGILRVDAWKRVSEEMRGELPDDLDISGCAYLTKLTFAGKSTAFVKDVYFEASPGDERRESLEELEEELERIIWRDLK